MRLLLIFVILILILVLFADDQAAEQAPAEEDAVTQAHRFFAADFFNKCWEVMDKIDRTADDDLNMINMAHASRAHWQVVGTADNWAVGEWQISRAYSLLERAEPCLYHAQACLRICQENDITGFNLGFAYEALGRAQHLLGNKEAAEEFIDLGRKAAADVESKEDKEYLLKELDSVLKK
ncbi:MAG: hypothetical protein K9N06_10755 [Candidatus Cloacimonetes bacterium]|nr:hypothetical protein [Candidatus Cloacimonadota bacterium]